MHSIENFVGSPTLNNPTFVGLPFMEPQTFSNVGNQIQATSEDTDRDNNEERQTASDYKRNETPEIINGTYVCTNCNAELFSSSARVAAKMSSDSTLDFSHAICNDAIHRITATEVKESIPVCFPLSFIITFTMLLLL